MMTTLDDEVPLPSTAQGGSSDGMDGVGVLSALLLSVLLKLEEREYRIPPSPQIQRESIPDPRKKWAETDVLPPRSHEDALEYDSEDMDQDVDLTDWVLVCLEDIGTDVLPDGDAIPRRYGYTTPQHKEYIDAEYSSPSSMESECSLQKETKDKESPISEGKPQDIILTSQMGNGDTLKPHPSPSVYQESAARIVSEALLRAIANIFINGVVRRSLRAIDRTLAGDVRVREDWSVSTNASNGNDDDAEVKQDSGDYYGVQVTKEEDRTQTTASAISAEWLLDVNRRIAAKQVTTMSPADLVPPSVASSCNVSRCSSVSVLSSGDRTLKVKATPPTQSKLLWKMVQKTHGGSGVLKTLHETEKPSDDSETDVQDSQREQAKFQEQPYDLETEKAILRAKLSVDYKQRAAEKISPGARWGKDLPTKRPAIFSKSKTQTKEDHFQVADDLQAPVESILEEGAKTDEGPASRAVDEEDHFESAEEAAESLGSSNEVGKSDEGMASRAVGETPQRQTLPPTAKPLLIDVVWRHRSHPSFTSQEMIALKDSYVKGSRVERQEAEGVVKTALHRAVSSLLVHKVISDSVASVSSTEPSQTDLRGISSFKETDSDFSESSLSCFQRFPYLRDAAVGSHEVAAPEKKIQDTESSDAYVDARDKFGSSDDLLTQDVKGHITSSEDEFADAICGTECPHMTSDKSIQVSDMGSPSQDESVSVDLPMESINFIKDQFYDVKALVAEYRELLYKPASFEEAEMRGTAAQPATKVKSKQKAGQSQDKKIAGKRSPKKEDTGGPSKKAMATPKVEHKKKGEIEAPSTSKSSRVRDKQETPKDEKKSDASSSPESVPIESVYEESSSEGLESTPRNIAKVEADKRRGKRKRKDFSPKDKMFTPRKLRKCTGRLRTPAGRSEKIVTVREKTTPDGFLPSSSGKKKTSKNSLRYPKKQYKTLQVKSGKHTVKKPRKETTPSKKTEVPEDISPEPEPKVQNRISFFEKISRHRMSTRNDTSTNRTPESKTPEKQAASYLGKLEKVSTKLAKKQKDDKETDGKRHTDFKHLRDKLNGSKKGERRDGTVVGSKKNPESGVDNSPGKGIWKNAAFFEALGKLDKPKTGAERLPVRARGSQKEEPFDEHDESTSTEKQRHPGLGRQVTRDRAPKPGDKTVAGTSISASSGKKPRRRNKNTNNQLVSTDDSCISSSVASDAKMGDIENEGLLPSPERDDGLEATGTEEPCVTALEEACGEAVPSPSKSIEFEDKQMSMGLLNSSEGRAKGSHSVLAIKEKKKKIHLPQKSSSERFFSLNAKTSDDPDLDPESASVPFHSSCDSMHPITPKGISKPSQKARYEVQNVASDQQLENKTDEDQKSSPQMTDDDDDDDDDNKDLTEKHEVSFGEVGTAFLKLPDSQESLEMRNVIRKCSDESQEKASLPSVVSGEGEELQVEGDQIHPLNLSLDLDDIGSLDDLLTPLSTSSPRPRSSVTSSVGTCSINGDRNATGVTDTSLVPEMDEVLKTRRNASFLRACNPEDYLETEDHFVTCENADDVDQVAKALKDADILTDISQKSSYHTDTASQEPIAGVQDAGVQDAESSDRKKQKKKRWRFKLCKKRKEKKKETKKRTSATDEAGEQTATPGNLPDEKQHHSLTVATEDAVTLATVAKATDQTEMPAESHRSPVPTQKRKSMFRSLSKSKRKTPKNS